MSTINLLNIKSLFYQGLEVGGGQIMINKRSIAAAVQKSNHVEVTLNSGKVISLNMAPGQFGELTTILFEVEHGSE